VRRQPGGGAYTEIMVREPDRGAHFTPCVLILLVAIVGAGCRSQVEALHQQQKALISLKSTATMLAESWLSGTISRAYTRTALERTRQLLEKQRTRLAASPDLLANPRGAALSDAEDHLSRLLALMWKAVEDGDPAAMRRHLSEIDAAPAARP
jgi:hypothetical protein